VSKQFDATIALQLDILRASEGVSRDVINILRELEKELIGKIASDNLTEWGRARVNKQLKEARDLIERYYDQIAVKSIADTDDIAKLAASVTASSISSAAVLPTAAVLDRIATDAVIQGAVQGAWWQKQAADVQFKFAAAVRQGLAGAETNQQIVQRVREVMDVSKRNAATLVQTSTATIANDARAAAMAANDDLILAYRAVATLDSKTCLTCAPLDGLEWTKAGKPIGGHKFPLPSYPIHMNCRCLLLGRVLDGEPGGTRASTDGQVSAALTFEGWLERQPIERQNDILGKGRAELYRKGTITLQDLVSGRGRPLTIEQLKARYT
jgi:SPP1 gp7 family putative phage head morphogenesis protein